MIRFPLSRSFFTICMSFFWSRKASTLPGFRSLQQMTTSSLVNGGIQIGRLWGTGTGPPHTTRREKMHNNSHLVRPTFHPFPSPEMDSVTSSILHNST